MDGCIAISTQAAANLLICINVFLFIGILGALFTDKMGGFERVTLAFLFLIFMFLINYFAFFKQGC